MNSIFLRIYGGMLVAMLLISAMSYGVVELVSRQRADQYREEMARGTFWLIANGTSRYHGADRDKWLGLITTLLGSQVSVVDDAAGHFSDEERARLKQGRVVFRMAGDDSFADIFIPLPAEPLYVTTRMTKVNEQQARATVLLVLDELGQYPLAQWDAVFANVQKHFGFPLARVPLADVRLDTEQRQRLLRREVVISLSENTPGAKSGVRVYARIGNTDEALVMGPLQLFDWLPLSLIIPVGAFALLMMTLAAYLLVRPLERRLKNLEKAVQQVAAGNLAVRAQDRGSDAVGQLASSFNGMTAHIARLIESQREMTRAVSHELRTPVARIRFGLEMMTDIESSAERARKVVEIDHDIDQLDDLIDEILTFARLEEGTPAIPFEPVDLAGLAQQVARELRPMSAQLAIDVEAPEELVVEGSERYLHRVLQNLVTNAQRYARTRVLVRVTADAAAIELVVEDDGPGIPEGDRERIFQPFARLDNSRHRASGGYGLGLSIVQRIAEWHGGRAWVDRAAIGGAAFHLRWPRLRGDRHALSS